MNKTILVIGSVTAKQYQDIRLGYLREGHKPHIIRAASWDEIDLNEEDLVRLYGSDDGSELAYHSPEWDVLFFSEDEATMKRLMSKHLEKYSGIAAIVMPDAVYGRVATNGVTPYVSYAEDFFEDVPIWRIHEWGLIELVP